MNSKINSSTVNYKTQPAEFIIPQKKYNEMLCDILGVKKITKSNILSLLSLQESVKKQVENICTENGFTPDDLLERSRVGIRKEKNNESKLLLRNGKKKLANINNKSDDDIINEMKTSLDKIIRTYKTDIIIRWPDGSINYSETMNNIEEYDENKESFAQATQEAKSRNKEKGKQITKTLSERDYKSLDDVLFEALQNSNKKTLGVQDDSILFFLKSKFSKIPKLYSKKAQKYFADKYYPMFDEKYNNHSSEKYLHDRKMVIIKLVKSGKIIAKVRGEIEIIDCVAKKIDEWKINLLKYTNTHVDQQKIEMLIQEIINIYYEVLHNVLIYNYNDKNYRRLIELDLEKISSEYREFQGKEIILLETGEFKEKLLNNAKTNLDIEKNKNSRTADLDKFNHSNIPNFNGFSSILDFYKDYFISSLDSKNPKDRSRKPGRREILQNFGFTIIDNDKTANRNKITIITNKKKAS